jgi:hypothetical protein
MDFKGRGTHQLYFQLGSRAGQLKDPFFFHGSEKPFADLAGPGDGKKRAAPDQPVMDQKSHTKSHIFILTYFLSLSIIIL